MPATTNSDKFLNAVPRWSGQVGAAGVSSTTATVIPLQSTTGLVNGRAYFFTFNRLTGTTKNPVSSTEGLVGVVNTSTNEITTTLANRGLEGAAAAWAAGTLVEILHSAGYMNRFIEGLEVSLNQDGTLKSTALDGTKVYAADAGSTDDYAITLAPAPTAYAAGQTFRFKANTANTGATTLNVNGLGAKTIKKNYNSDLATGDILANQLVEVIYDGTNFQMLSPVAGNTLTKASGTDITTGTDDTKYATSKAISDADLNTRLKTSMTFITRDMTSASGDVSYTGIGFKPTAMIAFANIHDSYAFSTGMSDSNKASRLISAPTNATMRSYNFFILAYVTNDTNMQYATVKSYDNDGFTLTWTKAGSPTGTVGVGIMCFK